VKWKEAAYRSSHDRVHHQVSESDAWKHERGPVSPLEEPRIILYADHVLKIDFLTGERQMTVVPAALSDSYDDLTIRPVMDWPSEKKMVTVIDHVVSK
jgi:hypothetical protein